MILKSVKSIAFHLYQIWMMVFLSILLNSNVAWGSTGNTAFVWQVQKSPHPPSYLIGTVHMGQNGSVLPLEYTAILSRTRMLVLESQESDWETAEGQKKLRQVQNMMQDQKTLGEHWGETRIAALNRLAVKNNSSIVLNSRAKMAPWAAWMQIATDYTLPNYSMAYGVDALLKQEAKRQRKAVVSLEGIEPVLAFKRIPPAVLVRAVDSHLRHHEDTSKQTLTLMGYYQRQQADVFAKTVLDENEAVRYFAKQDRAFWRQWLYADLLQQRNSTWLPKIERHMKQQPVTVAVGAAHLFGGSGLIALLKERGFTVTPYNTH